MPLGLVLMEQAVLLELLVLKVPPALSTSALAQLEPQEPQVQEQLVPPESRAVMVLQAQQELLA